VIFVSIYLLFIKYYFNIDFFNLIRLYIENNIKALENNNNIIFLFIDIVLIFGYYIFGLIFDCYKFKPLILVFTLFEIIIPIIIIFITVNDLFYYLISLFGLFVFASIQVLLYSELTRIFGIHSGPEILSINLAFIGIFNLTILCLKTFIGEEISKFNIIYILGAIICFIKLIVIFFFDENMFFASLNSKEDLIKTIDESF
jgi:predicted MFS family arabinose efflux permease